jgi:hypothetical protein
MSIDIAIEDQEPEPRAAAIAGRTCSECERRRVVVTFWHTKRTRGGKPDHDLCGRCWKAERDRQRVRQ